MGSSFDFELTAGDHASASILRIEDAVKKLNPQLKKTRDGLSLGGNESRDKLDGLNGQFELLTRNARSGVQFIGDLVPPLKMVGGLTLGLGGAAVAFNAVKNNLTQFADTGYRIDTVSKNISMTAGAFQELTGAMVENGSARDVAESSLSDLFVKANDAVHGRNDGFLALLKQRGVGIRETKEGLADVSGLIDDLNQAMQSLPAGQQALFANKLGLSPELLSYLRNTTSEVQRLKDQARRDGLIFTDKDLQNALAFKQQLNQIDASYDGILLKGQAWLGQSETLASSVDQIKQIMANGFDSATIGSILTFNRGGKQADIIRNAQKDDKFKDTLSWKEKLDLKLGYASEDLVGKLNGYYKPVWRAEQLKADLEKSARPRPEIINTVNTTNSHAVYGERVNSALGLRNNNPGNLRSAPNSTGRNGGFSTFDSPHDGLAALSRQLQLYGDRGNNTLNGIIHTYAPKSENKTQAYVDAVSKQTGFNPGDRLNLHSPEVLKQLIPAIIKHENGTQPYSAEDISQALNDSVNDRRWQGLRDQNRLAEQRQSGLFDNSQQLLAGIDRLAEQRQPGVFDNVKPPVADTHKQENNQASQSSLFEPEKQHSTETGQIIEAISKGIDEKKYQLEVILVNGQTGERQKANVDVGGRVSLPMQFY